MERSTRNILIVLVVCLVAVVGVVGAAVALGLHLRDILLFHLLHFLRHG